MVVVVDGVVVDVVVDVVVVVVVGGSSTIVTCSTRSRDRCVRRRELDGDAKWCTPAVRSVTSAVVAAPAT